MSQTYIIDGIEIGHNKPPFVIAEMSGNHNQSLEKALEIVEAAAKSGAHAIKLQTYTADGLTIDASHGLFNIENKNSLWKGYNLYQLYQKAATPWEWHKEIFATAQKNNIICFSSPFEAKAIDLLEKLGAPAYKIASFENADRELLKAVAQTGKPVIISTGLSTLAQIDETVNFLYHHGCKQLSILKCTSNYPANPSDSNLLTIPHLQQIYPSAIVGLSDHTLGIGVAVASIALGARIIEKHFTLNRNDGGVDAAFSLEPSEMNSLVVECNRAFESLGNVHYGIIDSEKASLQFKRSLYVVKDVKVGDFFTNENIRVIRPGDGIEPKFIEVILGMRAAKDIAYGTPFNWDLVK